VLRLEFNVLMAIAHPVAQQYQRASHTVKLYLWYTQCHSRMTDTSNHHMLAPLAVSSLPGCPSTRRYVLFILQ